MAGFNVRTWSVWGGANDGSWVNRHVCWEEYPMPDPMRSGYSSDKNPLNFCQATSCSRRPSSHAGTNGGNAFQLISCQTMTHQRFLKGLVVFHPEWKISICPIVGFPLKTKFFCHGFTFPNCIFCGIRYTDAVYPIFGQTCLPNCCRIDSVAMIFLMK